MKYNHLAAGAFGAAAICLAMPAHGQTPPDLSTIRKDIDTLRHDYEAKIIDLEARLAKAEADAADAHKQAALAAASASAAPLPDQVPVPQQVSAPAAPTSNNAFNPGIAVALNGLAVAADHDPSTQTIPGFATGGDIGGPQRGFSLGESEVSFAANIDPSLAAFFDFSLDDNSQVSLEEAYIRTTALPGGFTIKAGRFLSGIGYLNERHAHDWSFADAPLPYKAFLNTQLGDDGVQVRWIAPVDQYLEFGAEVFRGDAFPAGGAESNGAGSYSLFARTGSDIDASSSYLAALSYLHASSDNRATSTDLFSGDTDLGIASLVYKWAPGGNVVQKNLTLSGEYFYGQEDGRFNGLNLSQSHTGWYVQGVYQFMPMWSLGLRLAGLDSEDPGSAFAGTALDDLGHTPFSASALIEFDTSEFGRLRLQYTRDQSGLQDNDTLTLQYTVIYGPHGAHRY